MSRSRAEKGPLVAMLLDPTAIDAVAQVGEPADFYRALHGSAFAQQ